MRHGSELKTELPIHPFGIHVSWDDRGRLPFVQRGCLVVWDFDVFPVDSWGSLLRWELGTNVQADTGKFTFFFVHATNQFQFFSPSLERLVHGPPKFTARKCPISAANDHSGPCGTYHSQATHRSQMVSQWHRVNRCFNSVSNWVHQTQWTSSRIVRSNASIRPFAGDGQSERFGSDALQRSSRLWLPFGHLLADHATLGSFQGEHHKASSMLIIILCLFVFPLASLWFESQSQWPGFEWPR